MRLHMPEFHSYFLQDGKWKTKFCMHLLENSPFGGESFDVKSSAS